MQRHNGLAPQPVPATGRCLRSEANFGVAANMECNAMNDPNNRNPGQQREQPQREQQQRQNQQPGQKPGQKQDQKKSNEDMNKDHGDNRE